MNRQLDVAHTAATNTHRNRYSPFPQHRETAPRTEQNTRDFSLLSESSNAMKNQISPKPPHTTLVLTYCVDRGASDAFWRKRFYPEIEKIFINSITKSLLLQTSQLHFSTEDQFGKRLQKINWRLHQCNRAYTKQ